MGKKHEINKKNIKMELIKEEANNQGTTKKGKRGPRIMVTSISGRKTPEKKKMKTNKSPNTKKTRNLSNKNNKLKEINKQINKIVNELPECITIMYDQVVWAKLGGFPYWPALVCDPRKLSLKFKEDAINFDHQIKYYVFFYGTNNLSLLSAKNIEPWESKKQNYRSGYPLEKSKGKKRKDDMNYAISIADVEFKKTPEERAAAYVANEDNEEEDEDSHDEDEIISPLSKKRRVSTSKSEIKNQNKAAKERKESDEMEDLSEADKKEIKAAVAIRKTPTKKGSSDSVTASPAVNGKKMSKPVPIKNSKETIEEPDDSTKTEQNQRSTEKSSERTEKLVLAESQSTSSPEKTAKNETAILKEQSSSNSSKEDLPSPKPTKSKEPEGSIQTSAGAAPKNDDESNAAGSVSPKKNETELCTDQRTADGVLSPKKTRKNSDSDLSKSPKLSKRDELNAETYLPPIVGELAKQLALNSSENHLKIIHSLTRILEMGNINMKLLEKTQFPGLLKCLTNHSNPMIGKTAATVRSFIVTHVGTLEGMEENNNDS